MPSSNLSSGYVVFQGSVTVSCDSDTGVKTMGSNGKSPNFEIKLIISYR